MATVRDHLPLSQHSPNSITSKNVEFFFEERFYVWLVANLKQNEAKSARAWSTHKGVNWRSKYVTQVQQQRPESPTLSLTWRACKYRVHTSLHFKMYLWWSLCSLWAVPLVEIMHLVFPRMPGESHRRPLLLHLCYVLRALINSLVCWFVWLVGVFTVCIFWVVFIAASA